MALAEGIKTRIDTMVGEDKVVLFMKGTKAFPQCGFSSTIVQLLSGLGVEFNTHNVLADAELRSGIKEYSDWPTIPQLYIAREFVGGSDIVKQMTASGELHALLGLSYEPPKAPQITVTDAMVAAFKAQTGDQPGHLRLEVGAKFQYGLGLDTQATGDFAVETNGITVLIDPTSASRADGITIDYEEGPNAGVVIDNPNAPKPVKQLSVSELKAMMDGGKDFELLDVRSPEERETASIEGSHLLDQQGMAYVGTLAKDTSLVFHCHHGGRSQEAADHFRNQGYTDVHNVVGGIDAWSIEIDANSPRY
jgi:monothiol glutaredoxin